MNQCEKWISIKTPVTRKNITKEKEAYFSVNEFIACRNEGRRDQLPQLMEDVCRNIDLSKPKRNDDMAIIILQSLEVRIYLETIFFM